MRCIVPEIQKDFTYRSFQNQGSCTTDLQREKLSFYWEKKKKHGFIGPQTFYGKITADISAWCFLLVL